MILLLEIYPKEITNMQGFNAKYICHSAVWNKRKLETI